MTSPSCSLAFSFAFFIFIAAVSSSTGGGKLHHFRARKKPIADPFNELHYLVSSSMARALHLKNPYNTTLPLSTNRIGAYSLPLNVGTPPQSLTFLMDTGSNFVWSPCTSRYVCKRCSNLLPTPTTNIPAFIPKQSSSSKILSCSSPKCSWIHHRISRCDEEVTQCSPYFIFYGTGSTGGVPMLDTLRLKDLTVPDFLIGCSVVSTGQPAGIAGMGRGSSSLPSQLNLTKFSYCSFSFKSLNDQSAKSSVLLDYSPSRSHKKTEGMIYTPFLRNPRISNKLAYLVYYYVGIRGITVGGRNVKIPFKFLTPNKADGNGGAVIDSGSTFSYLSRDIFDLVSREMIAQMTAKGNKRNVAAETENELGPCFDSLSKNLSVPQIAFRFKGGSQLVLPMENYMATVGNGAATVCLAVITDQGGDEGEGPGIILGNFQFQNYHIEYDLANERLGFKRQQCQ